jgi:O-antigen/teichoic acid export membrane protein
LKRTGGLLAVAAVSALLTIGYLIYAGRVLGPSEYAEFSTALSFIYFFAIALSPLTPAIARVVARRAARGDARFVPAMRRGVVRPLAAALLLLAILLVWPVIELSRFLNFRSTTPLALAFATVLVFTLLSADRGFLQGLFRFGAYNSSVLVESFVRIVAGVAVLQLVSQSASGAMVGYFTAVIAAELVNAALLGGRGAAPQEVAVDWPELRRLFLPMMMLMVAAAVCQNIDMMAVKRWFAADFAGHYGAASALAKMFGVVFTPLYVLLGPMLTRHHERGENIVGPALQIAAIFAALSSVGLLLLIYRGEEIVALLFGVEFTPAAWVAAHLGAISILLHTSLLLTQVFITVHDFRFLKLFAIAAIVQVSGLALFHATVTEVLITLYAAQAVLLLPLSVQLVTHRHLMTRSRA